MMDKSSFTLFLNPSSKNFKGKRNWKFFLNKGMREIVSENSADLLNKVVNDKNDVAVAVGGDGTINLVINGILKSGNKRKFGVLYSGTSPDFCKFHRIPIDPQEAMRVLLKNESTEIDVCKLFCQNREISYFASGCNIGLGAKIADISNRLRKYFGDFSGTLIASMVTLATAKSFEAKIKIDDDKEFFFRKVTHIAVLKNNFLASGLRVEFDAKSDDGMICVVVLEKLSPGDFLKIYKGKIPKEAYVRKCRTVEIGATPRQRIEYDGDSYGFTSVKIECMNKALELIK